MNWKITLSVLFGTSIVVANLTASKLAFFTIPLLGGVAVPAGFVAIGVAFLCTDTLGELYGQDAAQNAVYATVGALILAYGLVVVAIHLPVAPFYKSHDAYQLILGSGLTIVIASIITTGISQSIDVAVFHRLRERANGKHKWLRNLGSTGVSQLVDTAVFITLAFVVLPVFVGGTTTPLVALPGMIIGQYAVKLVVAIADTPLFYIATH